MYISQLGSHRVGIMGAVIPSQSTSLVLFYFYFFILHDMNAGFFFGCNLNFTWRQRCKSSCVFMECIFEGRQLKRKAKKNPRALPRLCIARWVRGRVWNGEKKSATGVQDRRSHLALTIRARGHTCVCVDGSSQYVKVTDYVKTLLTYKEVWSNI